MRFVGDIVNLVGMGDREYIIKECADEGVYVLYGYKFEGRYVYSEVKGHIYYAREEKMILVEDFRGIKPKKFRVVVAGGRHFEDYDLLEKSLNNILKNKVSDFKIVIVSGGATGADSLGERYAKQYNYGLEVFPANWGMYGNGAGHIRNREMYEVCDAVVAFWDGFSKGTKNMIGLCKDKPVRIIRY